MSAGEFSGVTIGLGVVRGVRSFDVDTFGRLTGINYKTPWKPGENEARCLANPYEGMARNISAALTAAYSNAFTNIAISGGGGRGGVTVTAPTPDPPKQKDKPAHGLDSCTCGFYAYYDGSDDYKTDARISAVVEGYGETLIGTRGFRASKARLAAICIPEATAKRRRPHWVSILLVAAAIAFVAAGVLAFVLGHAANGWIDIGLAVFYGGMGVLNNWLTRNDRKPATTDRVSPDLLAKVRRNYPEVPMFTSFKAMVAAFPPDRGIEPSPDSDPKFWER